MIRVVHSWHFWAFSFHFWAILMIPIIFLNFFLSFSSMVAMKRWEWKRKIMGIMRMARRPGVRRVMLELSLEPVPWSALLERVSNFPMLLPGQWYRAKLNQARKSDHLGCLQLSFLAVMKYSRFLWLAQISNLCSVPSRKYQQNVGTNICIYNGI